MSQNTIKYGAKAGINLYGFDKTYFAYGEGLLVGGFAILETENNKLNYRADIAYSQKGGAVNYSVGFFGYQIVSELDYIDIPILIEYEILKNLSVFGGIQLGFLINAVTEDSRTGLEEKSTDGYNTIDFSIASGLKYEFWDKLFLEVKLSYGLTKVLEEFDSKNFPLSFSLNYVLN